MLINPMKAFILSLCLPVLANAQESALDKLASRQAAFGRTIPQEKVFIHMDNTSYQLGDTIWFSAYTRRTDTGKPSDVSGVLYVELYGQEGYMIERKLIQMKEGRGSGFFALTKQIQYAGFYELRAYTRWQLNWGCFEHEHTQDINKYFDSKRQAKEFFRDYEKLYSRVFPVYDKPTEPGDFNHDMTLRAMRRNYKSDTEKRELKLSLYPEGGNLVEGLPCRVAFEAAWDDGECAEGSLIYAGDSAKTLNRGRGRFEVIPSKGMETDVLFVSKEGETVRAKLPKMEQTGVSIRVGQDSTGWLADILITDDLPTDSLALSLMHEGRQVFSSQLNNSKYTFNEETLSEAGIYQLTVFDTQGRVLADRLFFSRGKETLEPTLSIEGLKDEYQPYEPVSLVLHTPKGQSNVSLTVRDDIHRDCLYDDGNILTEMLLSSEIRGFVPQPGWYFEQDDEEHRTALDLLMLTQGWRRFDWRSMAIKGLWNIVQPAEKAPILIGSTYKNYTSLYDKIIEGKDEEDEDNEGSDEYEIPQTGDWGTRLDERERDEADYRRALEKNPKKRTELKVHAEQVMVDYDKPVECECVTDRGRFHIQLLPYYGQSVLFLSVADTTKWKKGKPYTWIQSAPDDMETDFMYLPANSKLRRKIFVEPADHLARISWPYPRFVKPYTFYQNHLAPLRVPQEEGKETSPRKGLDGVTTLRQVSVKAKRHGLRKFDDTWPILSIDALEAANMSIDYGVAFNRLMVGVNFGVGTIDNRYIDIGQEGTFETRYGYGQTRRMLMDKEIPADSIYARKYLISGSFILTTPDHVALGKAGDLGTDYFFQLSPGESLEYMGSGVWDKYVFYSDYTPRMYGNKQYYGDGEPKTKLVMYPYPDGSRRMTYRDRRYILNGFAYPAEFYSPDYSKQELPPKGAEETDYRRTLYWNPDVKIDESGEAIITFYNNCRQSQLSVDAEGQSSDGTLLWTQ